MSRKLAALFFSFLFSLAVRADFDASRQAAAELYEAGRRDEAIAALERLADASESREQKTKALQIASSYALRTRDYERALRLALGIPNEGESNLVQLRVLSQAGRNEQIVEGFEPKEIEGLPGDLRGEAFRLRGSAALRLGLFAEAEADLAAAVRHGLHYHYRGMALVQLGDLYRDQFNNEEKAIAAYREVYAERCKWAHQVAAVRSAAEILLGRGDAEAALRELDTAEQRNWATARGAVEYLKLRGRTLAALDRPRDAVQAYRDALKAQDISAEAKAAVEKEIEALMLGARGDLVLAAKGKSEHQVVLPQDVPSERVATLLEDAANLVQKAFRANGFDIPIVREDERDPGKPGIYIGDTRFARANNVDPAAIDGWGYVHKAVGNDVIVVGNDKPHPLKATGSRNRPTGARVGTVKGAVDFLRDCARARFVYPCGETGIEFLQTPVISVPAELDFEFKPKLDFFWSNWMGGSGATDADWEFYFIANNYYPNIAFVGEPHTYPKAVPAEEYAESNPEYFALIGGKRTASDDLCVSNPEVQELLYQNVLRDLDMGYDMAVLGQQDGFRACQCEECRALFGTGDDWGEKLWILHRRMADRLLEDRPGKKMILLVYGETWEPPKSFKRFPPNVMLRMRSPNEERRAAWRNHEVPGGYFASLSHFGTYGSFGYLPRQTPRSMESLVKTLHEFGFRGIFLDIAFQNFGLQGPTYYVLGRLWQDPASGNAVELLEEYYAAAFQEAAIPMERFYDTLHHALNLYLDAPASYTDIYGMNRRRITGGAMQIMTTVFQPDTLDDMETFLSQAEEMAAARKAKARLALVRLEFDYLRRLATMSHARNAYRAVPSHASRGLLLDAVDAANAYIDRMLETETRRRPIPEWPEARFLMAHNRTLITRGFHNTPLSWDTAEMRDAPLPGARTLNVQAADGPLGLDAAAWEKAAACEFEAGAGAGSGAPPTSVRALFDRRALYLRFESQLPGGVADVALAEDLTKQESIEIVVNPSGDREKLYRFIVGLDQDSRYAAARGFIEDTLHPLHGKDDPDWGGEWDYRSRVDPDTGRWLALAILPFETLGAEPPGPGTLWRGNFGRARPAEAGAKRSVWSPARNADAPKTFGEILFSGAAAKARHPLAERREEMYRKTFRLPDEWRDLPGALDLSGDWRFSPDVANRGAERGWHEPDLNDAGWARVPVPAFWDETDLGRHTGYAWYRTAFEAPPAWEGRPVRLCFAGVDEQAWVYLNGRLVREHTADSENMAWDALWDRPFEAIAPPEGIRYGRANTVAVRVHNKASAGGIWRPVLCYADPDAE